MVKYWGLPGWIFTAVVVLCFAAIAKSCISPPAVAPPITTDTISGAQYLARIAALQAQIDQATTTETGLRGAVQRLQNRVRGLEARAPEVIHETDTIIDIKLKPVMMGFSLDDRSGRVTIYDALPDTGGHRPRVLSDIDIKNCDSVVAVAGSDQLACDTAPFGHTALYTALNVRGDSLAAVVSDASLGIGLEWKKCARCRVAVSIEAQSPDLSNVTELRWKDIRWEATAKIRMMDLW